MKPFPDEPWRYVCPSCESTAVSRKPAPTVDQIPVSCGGCFWHGQMADLVDQKTEERVGEVKARAAA